MSTALPRPKGTSGRSVKLPDANDELIALAGKLKARVDAAQANYDDAVAAIKVRLGKGTYTAGGVVIKVEDNNRVDKDKIIEQWGDEVQSMQFDTNLAKRVMGEDVYRDFMRPTGLKVTTTVTNIIPED